MLFGSSRRGIISSEAWVRASFHGPINGVLFDLRHPGIDPKAWECPPLTTTTAPGHPGFYFEADDAGSPAGLLGLLSEPVAASTRSARDEAIKRGAVILRDGDRVTTASVEFAGRESGDPLAHAVDRERALLRLQVSRTDGSSCDGGQIWLRRHGQLVSEDEWGTFDKLLRRLPDIPVEQDALHRLDELKGKIEAGRHEIEELLPDEGSGESLFALLPPSLRLGHLIDAAVLYGYRHGRAEAAAMMEPLARKSIDRSQQASEAARLKAEKDPETQDRRRFAIQHWAEHPTDKPYTVAQLYLNQPGKSGFDQNSVVRSIKHLKPT